MFCYIKEWPNKMATLMTADGIVLCTCENTDAARQVWRDWKRQQFEQHALESTDAELEILPYSPTIGEWLKSMMMDCYARKEKKAVNG